MSHEVIVALLIAAGVVFLANPWRIPAPANLQTHPPARAFRNPANGYEEAVGTPWLPCLLFGCIYFAARGIWTHAAASLLLTFVTFGMSWFIYPFFARQIVETNYLRRGWIRV
jgi:hypothetical protein